MIILQIALEIKVYKAHISNLFDQFKKIFFLNIKDLSNVQIVNRVKSQ